MSAFENEVKRLVESQWVAQSAVESLEAFHKAGISQARTEALEEAAKWLEKYLEENRSGQAWEDIKESKKKGAYEMVAFFKGVEMARDLIIINGTKSE